MSFNRNAANGGDEGNTPAAGDEGTVGGPPSGWPIINEQETQAIEKQIAEESCGAACAVTLLGDESISQADIGLEAMSPEQLAARLNDVTPGGWQVARWPSGCYEGESQ